MGAITGVWFFIIIMTSLVIFVSGVWLLIQAFKEHFLWGLALIFIPLAYVVFAALNWKDSARPFLLGLAATVFLIIELMITGGLAALFGS